MKPLYDAGSRAGRVSVIARATAKLSKPFRTSGFVVWRPASLSGKPDLEVCFADRETEDAKSRVSKVTSG